jgi:hypothetical protein
MTNGQGSLLEGIEAQETLSRPRSPSSSSAHETDPLKWIKIGGSILAVAVAAFLLQRTLSGMGDPAAESNTAVLIDSETLEVVKNFRLPPNGQQPYVNPKTGRKTLYYTEKCFWMDSKRERAKLTPTYVLLNEYIGKPGRTVCPDCGAPVQARNPIPSGELMAEAVEREKGKK